MNTISTIQVTGHDAFEFLGEQEILAAWCNPKGRVIWFGTVRRIDNGYALSAAADMADTIVKRLTMFRFRSKVDLNVVDEGQTVDPAFLVENGYPFIGAAQSEQFTPHMLNLDLLDAISFDKGCFPGQEIVARTHYKGATKRRTVRFTVEQPVRVGDKVSLEGRDIGDVLNVAGTGLLAVVPVDKADETLTIGGSSLKREQLPYH
jgi:folate-binding protein YgfZ